MFEREYADANWYKGKQRKYVEGREVVEAKRRAGLGWSLSVLAIRWMLIIYDSFSRSCNGTPTHDI